MPLYFINVILDIRRIIVYTAINTIIFPLSPTRHQYIHNNLRFHLYANEHYPFGIEFPIDEYNHPTVSPQKQNDAQNNPYKKFHGPDYPTILLKLYRANPVRLSSQYLCGLAPIYDVVQKIPHYATTTITEQTNAATHSNRYFLNDLFISISF